MKVGGVKILSSSLGMIRMDRIRDEYIRGTAHVFDVLDVYSGGSVDVSLEAVVPNPRLRIGAGLVGHLVPGCTKRIVTFCQINSAFFIF